MVNLNDDIKLVDMTTRTIYLNTGVDSNSVTDAVIAILKINEFDDEQEVKLKNYERQPIKLVVDSYGGSVYDGISMVTAISTSKTPVHGYCHSKAMSMGFLIYISTHKRFAGKYATFMSHQLSGGHYGTNQDLVESANETNKLNDMLMKITTKRTKITKKQLKEKNRLKQDWYIVGKEAVELGIVDELIKETY